jgi:hypothetical protein
MQERNEGRRMTTHAPISHADRSLLPRSLLGRRARTYCANWTYRIGQRVDYYGDTAIVISRQRNAMGREIYDVWFDCAERPRRTILGSALKPAATPKAEIGERHIELA